MASLVKEGVLRLRWSPGLQFVRWRRVNVQRPRPPHYDRALALALLTPQYESKPVTLPKADNCLKPSELVQYRTRPDNPLEKILARELKQLLDTKKLVVFLHANPISGDGVFNAKVKLKKEGMTLEVYSKHCVRLAVQDTPYEVVNKIFVAHNAMIFGDEPKVGKLIKILKKVPQYIMLAGIIEGRLLSVSQMQAYSELGDLTIARSQLVATLNSTGSGLVSRLTQAQTNLVTHLNQIADQKKEPDS